MPALPVRFVLITGLSGAVVSSVASFGLLAPETLPLISVALAVTFPSGMSTVGVIVTIPSTPAVASPILVPFLSNNSTLEPGSVLTSTGVFVCALSVRSVTTTGCI